MQTVQGPFTRCKIEEFNLGSRHQIAKRLQKLGWKPKKFTKKGTIKVSDDILSAVTNISEAQMIGEYFMLSKRKAFLTSWIKETKEDNRVHGYVNTIGAITERMTHSSPNMAQVPSCNTPYGTEFRSLWTVPEGYKLVGCDASGLELRMLAHYMQDAEYIKVLIEGDIHNAIFFQKRKKELGINHKKI